MAAHELAQLNNGFITVSMGSPVMASFAANRDRIGFSAAYTAT